MDFNLDEQQQQLQDSCRRLLEDSCAFDQRRPLIEAGSFTSERWQTYADMGWLGMSVPEGRGGLGWGAVETSLLMEEVGRTLCVEPLWAIGVYAAQLLVALAPTSQTDALLAGLVVGKLRPVVAHGEAEARGDVAYVQTEAKAQAAGSWTLHGVKTLVVGGNVADGFMVSARTSGEVKDAEGISLFWVPADAPGLQRKDVRLIDNRWCAHLTLNGVLVKESDLLCPLGGAYPALDTATAHATVAMCAEAMGLMDRALWVTRDYLKMRKQFGTTLASFQVVQHRMSDMLVEMELARSMLYRAISLLTADSVLRNAAISATKVHVAQSGYVVCGQAIQLSGGIGVTEEYIVGHYFKRMTLIESALGATAVHLERLAERQRSMAN